MGITVTTSGETPRFDIFDNGLALLALHSACLALAFTALQNAKPLADAFNLTWMAAGFAFGAVLAVLAAYYGTINARALGPQLMGQPQPDERLDIVETASAAESLSEGAEGQSEVPETMGFGWGAQTAPPVRTELRSRLIVTGVVLFLFVLVGVAINEVADKVDDRYVATARAEAGRPPAAADAAEASADNVRVNAADTPEAKAARETIAEADARKRNKERRWRAWMMVGLAGLVLLPLPFAWTGPSPFLSAARGFLVLGSLLSFVLGVGVALLPLATSSVEKGINQAISADQSFPGADRPDQEARRDPAALTVAINSSEKAATGGRDEPHDRRPTATADDIARLEHRLGDLQGAFANATAARDVHVTMTDPRPAAQINVQPAPIKVMPPEVVPQLVVGDRGPQGEPGLVRRCGLQASWPVFACRWTTAPDAETPAPMPPF